MKNISPLYKISFKGGGWDEQRQPKMQPSAEIVRVECAKCRRDPLRRSCASSMRNLGESAMRPARGQPSAENVRVECAKCRRECDLSGVRATLCGHRACRVREMQARDCEQHSAEFGRPASYFLHYIIYSEENHHLPLPAAQMLTSVS